MHASGLGGQAGAVDGRGLRREKSKPSVSYVDTRERGHTRAPHRMLREWEEGDVQHARITSHVSHTLTALAGRALELSLSDDARRHRAHQTGTLPTYGSGTQH